MPDLLKIREDRPYVSAAEELTCASHLLLQHELYGSGAANFPSIDTAGDVADALSCILRVQVCGETDAGHIAAQRRLLDACESYVAYRKAVD